MPDLLQRLQSALSERYAIERELGRGGMATVFLAEDLKHRRKVALKVLHPEIAAALGPDRFLREIETVAGLQHPHILPLYDSGEADGLLYYVMPYAEGESLRQRLDRERQLGVAESLRIAIEVADGLDYAHRKGVIHRDIKPGNILMAEGHATIADFGIARAIEAAREDRMTSTGLGVGTALYASPEQAAGEDSLDGRADIYSLGCVLYEMLAGEPPLTGVTPQMILARRLSETPTALHSLRDTVPPALDGVLAKALARVPADRHATAAVLGRALLQVSLTTAAAGVVTDAAAEASASAPRGRRRARGPAHGRRAWRAAGPTILAAAVVIAGGVWIATHQFGRGPPQVTVSNATQVTSEPGVEFQPALSPDGSEVAYVEGAWGSRRVVVRSAVEGGGSGGLRPAEDAGGDQVFPAWTPDGASVRFCDYSFPSCDWKRVGKLGGFVQAVAASTRSWQRAWSHDGTRSVYAAGSAGDSIFVDSAEDSIPRLLAVHTVQPWRAHSFTWSPDDRWIAYVNGNPFWLWGPNVAPASIWILDSRGGKPIRVTDQEHLNTSPQWLPDGRTLLFVSDRDGARGIYVVEVGPRGPKGTPGNVLPSSDAHSISISADGRKLAYSRLIEKQNIWSIAIPGSGPVSISQAVRVTAGNQVIERHDVSPDGEWIAFDSKRREQFDVYRMPLGGGPARLVADVGSDAYEPDWSPDGTEIAFFSFEGRILVVSASGGTPEVIADFPGFDGGARWSPDGLAIAFESEGPEPALPNKIWMVEREDVGLPWGDPVRLTDFGCGEIEWAPDGTSLLCRGKEGIIRVPRDGGDVSVVDRPPGLRGFGRFRFSRDGSGLYFSAADEDGWEGLWRMPAGGGNPERVVAYDDPTRSVIPSSFSVGPEHLYFTISENESDIRVVDLEW
jgi:serine/threonine-protein kinase